MPTTTNYALRYPASTDPADVPTDMQHLAADVDTVLRSQSSIGARANNNAAIGVANATWTLIGLNSEDWDTDTIHDPASNSHRLTAKTAGKYLITGSIQYTGNNTGERFLAINAGDTPAANQIAVFRQVGDVGGNWMQVHTLWDLAVNAFVSLQTYQSSGGVLNIVLTAEVSPVFAMVRVA